MDILSVDEHMFIWAQGDPMEATYEYSPQPQLPLESHICDKMILVLF